jgi:hypothetical protein
MMSVLEYAQDMNKSVEEIIKMCGKLGIDVKNEDDMLLHLLLVIKHF